MDGTIAVIVALFGLGDMALNDCATGCFARNDDSARFSLSAGRVNFQGDTIANEVRFGYDFNRSYGPFQPTVSAAVTDQGDVWIGGGIKWRTDTNDTPIFFEGSFQPGMHIAGEGPDLGGELHFRSALGVGYEFENGGSVLVSFDHRSNGDIEDVNPGMEVLSFTYSMAFN